MREEPAGHATYYHGSPRSDLTGLRAGSYISSDRAIAELMGRYHKRTGKTWSDDDLAEPHYLGRAAKFLKGREPRGKPTIYAVLVNDKQVDKLGNPYEHKLRRATLVKVANQETRPHAVIIHGNPRWVNGKDKVQADAFYTEIAQLLAKKYDVSHDAGRPYTTPRAAALWVGHSRGADRLRFAEKGTKTIAVGSLVHGSVNHPQDIPTVGSRPAAAHYQLTPDMRRRILHVIANKRREPHHP